jgi:hypothetical protein
VRLALSLDLQSVRVDASRRYDAIPSVELGATF